MHMFYILFVGLMSIHVISAITCPISSSTPQNKLANVHFSTTASYCTLEFNSNTFTHTFTTTDACTHNGYCSTISTSKTQCCCNTENCTSLFVGYLKNADKSALDMRGNIDGSVSTPMSQLLYSPTIPQNYLILPYKITSCSGLYTSNITGPIYYDTLLLISNLISICYQSTTVHYNTVIQPVYTATVDCDLHSGQIIIASFALAIIVVLVFIVYYGITK